MNRIEKRALRDRILGAWVGKSYGAAMGEPIEFKYVGEIYEGPSDVQEVHLRDWLVNEDDLYMNMGMLKVVRRTRTGGDLRGLLHPVSRGRLPGVARQRAGAAEPP